MLFNTLLLLAMAVMPSQDGGAWIVSYPIPPGESFVSCKVDGIASNSSVPGDGLPKVIAADIDSKMTATAKLHDECSEKITVKISDQRVIFRLQHEHDIYNKTDPLLGWRKITIKFNRSETTDGISLTKYKHPDPIRYAWKPTERLATTDKDIALLDEYSYTAFIKTTVNRNTRVTVSFWYLTNPKKSPKIGIEQYGDGMNRWHHWQNTEKEYQIPPATIWKRFEMFVKIQENANSLAVRIIAPNDPDEYIYVRDFKITEVTDRPEPNP